MCSRTTNSPIILPFYELFLLATVNISNIFRSKHRQNAVDILLLKKEFLFYFFQTKLYIKY